MDGARSNYRSSAFATHAMTTIAADGSADNPDPAWGKFWRVRPLIITPLAAAFGFLAFSLKDIIRPEGNLYKAVVYMASLVIFVIALWLGIVLGLDGTLWN